jgi:hypothetical protein
VRSFFRTCFTTRDNATGDIGRVLWTVTLAVFLGLEIYSVVVLHTPFAMTEFASAAGMVLMAGGGALLIKHSTEPSPPGG